MFNQYKMAKQESHSVTDKRAVNVSIKHGQSQANMYCDNGVPDSTICGWLNDEEKLLVL